MSAAKDSGVHVVHGVTEARVWPSFVRWLAVVVVAAGCSTTAAVQTATTVPTSEVAEPTTAPDFAASSTSLRPTPPSTSGLASTSSTANSPTATSSTATAPVRAPIVLGFAGDTSFTDGLDRQDPFGNVLELLRAPDLMVVNLETAVADPGVGRPPVDKRFLFRSPPASLDLVVDAGIDVVALANNHTLDFGPEALAQTLDEIDARALGRVGAGLDEASAYAPLIVEVGEWTVGLVSLSRVPCDWSASGENVRPQVAWACPTLFDRAEAAAAEALERADVVVVMIHGGEEGVLCPSPFMIELEEAFAEMGVDAVINGHPHVLQGLTRQNDTWIAHSLGNFAFPAARGITGNSAIVQLHVAEEGVELSVIPIRSDGGVLSLPTEVQRADILGQAERYSQGVSIEGDGRVVLDATNPGEC